jgi:hypothetical protein
MDNRGVNREMIYSERKEKEKDSLILAKFNCTSHKFAFLFPN